MTAFPVILRVVLVPLGLLGFLVWALGCLMTGQEIVEVVAVASTDLCILPEVVVGQLLREIRLALHQIVADALHGLRRVVRDVAPDVGLLAHVGEEDTLLRVARLWHVCVLVGDVDAISSHHHLAVELVIYLVHGHLGPSGAGQDAAGQATSSEAWGHVEATVVARGAHTLVDSLSRNRVLLALVLARLQRLHLAHTDHSLGAELCLSLRNLCV